ncbi:Hsp20/alpha crystallin family protein [Lactobacillus delbrueckii subsp. lactis]|jgi:HSP20 family protein|uniref:Hsp20/alpha crystallin family protein n=4 Tax=Lactobacillus TaxID=1578 RepID=A0A061CGR3_LACDL|nr:MULTISPECIES: Hsp20/alpha crystallin family protein [Lactobacillus]ADQ60298.1 Molecular chaperone (Small heat shock protein) [Lactobacillus delbrueckii subsp. bulgaricus ND02]APG67594.1 heat-shock protein Hsp20 [Lactobacillus delbrueckii subsp. lactis]APG69960.1 heat-shock protein Hsp20 [Lactobacillus delbrueckii subsp. lactis]APG70835.1 heat-shock protein Hsp20 [Lactobacillus delbrueckii subsp. delbrueckii]APG72735.1 heat-shock protein Hsp20 [Lactobacillus delbrueckii subsp. jakobsenii ZN7
MTNDLMNRYNDLFDHMGDWLDKLDSHAFRNILQSDVAEDEHEYTVKIDVPGMSKDDIHLSYTDGILTISAHRSTFKDDSDKKKNLLRQERSEGSVSRSFSLPNVDKKGISAKLDGGVLTVTLPKVAPEENADTITIE